jgi:hypothetical protein
MLWLQIYPNKQILNTILIVSIVSDGVRRDVIVYCIHYAFWEGEETMVNELFRNLILAACFVLLTTLILIASVPACILVAVSVAMTLVSQKKNQKTLDHIYSRHFYFPISRELFRCTVGYCIHSGVLINKILYE